MVVVSKGFGSNHFRKKAPMRVVLQSHGSRNGHHWLGATDAMPSDIWLRDRGVDPTKVMERKITKVNGERSWLVVVRGTGVEHDGK